MFSFLCRDSGYAFEPERALDSRAELNAALLCVDFPNKPAAASLHPEPSYFYELLVKDGLRVLEKLSYGRFRLNVRLIDRWFTMPKNDDEYGMERVISYETHRNYIRDALDASCEEVDYDALDLLYIVPVHGSAVPYSPTMVMKNSPIPAKNGSGIGSVVTFGADLYYRKGKLFAHETGHLLGLPDLYTYSVPEGCRDCFSLTGAFDLMGLIEGAAPDYLGYSKWRLGWMDDEQVTVVNAGGSGDFTLTGAEIAGGSKLILLPVDECEGYVVEYRRCAGLDVFLEQDGVLVYRVDGKLGSGEGPVTVIPPREEQYRALNPRKGEGLLLEGDFIELPDGDSIGRKEIRVTSLGGGTVRIERT